MTGPLAAAVDLPTTDQESEIRAYLAELMPLEHAPAHLRLAFHDAGTYDMQQHVGGANGSVRLADELRRADNAGWGPACFELLAEVKSRYPHVSWADLVALGGAAAVQKCGGPIIQIGMGRTDSDEPAAPHRLPAGYEGGPMLKRIFARLGLSPRDLIALLGAHTLGHYQMLAFTPDPWAFSNSYYVHLLRGDRRALLPSDEGLLGDPELRQLVEAYAQDEALFRADFADAYRRLTWLGY